MAAYRKIITGLVLAGVSGLYGCELENNSKQQKSVVESKIEYFLDKGSVGNTGAQDSRQGVSIALGDIDGDGDLDIITATAWPRDIKYFENIGDGKYLDRGSIGNTGAQDSRQGVGIALGDIDGDGDLDIITATAWPRDIKYFENKLPQKNKNK